MKKSIEKADTKDIMSQMKYFEGTLRPYQMEGVQWLKTMYDYSLNAILADEMGLGKTIQVIAFIAHLTQIKVNKPFLIVVPLSTLPNWESEFKRFAPQLPLIVFYGKENQREALKSKVKSSYTIKEKKERVRPVILTTYQTMVPERSFFRSITWEYLIVDEGQKIKNHKSQLATELRSYPCKNKLLLTGTPLQNNLTELWSLLNFLMPIVFNKIDTFSFLLNLEDVKDSKKIIEEKHIITSLHKVVSPFMLRRLKEEVLQDVVPKKEVIVYCPMSKLQRELYKYVLNYDIESLLDKNKENANIENPRKKRKCTQKPINYNIESLYESPNKQPFHYKDTKKTFEENQQIIELRRTITMSNRMMMFKKIVCHPYLITCPVKTVNNKKEMLIDENLIQNSGKFFVLDILLPKLKERGHKILLFCTMVAVLDIIHEYLKLRGYKFCRLDGNSSVETRQYNINEFNKNLDLFIFLISTRAGGLGINLTSADTVIMFDRDWNPQADIQAQDRCHRIGQKKPVVIYSLITKNTIDEYILKCSNMKKRLERLVIREGKFGYENKIEKNFDSDFKELGKMFKLSDREESNLMNVFSEDELNRLLDRSDLHNLMEKKEFRSIEEN